MKPMTPKENIFLALAGLVLFLTGMVYYDMFYTYAVSQGLACQAFSGDCTMGMGATTYCFYLWFTVSAGAFIFGILGLIAQIVRATQKKRRQNRWR